MFFTLLFHFSLPLLHLLVMFLLAHAGSSSGKDDGIENGEGPFQLTKEKGSSLLSVHEPLSGQVFSAGSSVVFTN